MATNSITGPVDPAISQQASVLRMVKNTVDSQNKSALALIQSVTAETAQSPTPAASAAGPLSTSGGVGTKMHVVG